MSSQKIRQADRINYSVGRKLSDGNYGSIDVHFCYTSDIEDSETKEEATKRVIDYVEKVMREKITQYKQNLNKKGGN